jgi:hypothetical protein
MKVLWHMKGLPRELKKHFPERPRVVLLGEPPREDGVGGGAVGCEEGGSAPFHSRTLAIGGARSCSGEAESASGMVRSAQ